MPAISIHTPRVGSDQAKAAASTYRQSFQSTLPVWGATRVSLSYASALTHFNPHSPCGERRIIILMFAPHYRDFNPHSPCGERQPKLCQHTGCRHFNPHSPCGERPLPDTPHGGAQHHFNPHSPCGERPRLTGSALTDRRFQSTLPVWGATCKGWSVAKRNGQFQSTLPVWGATDLSYSLKVAADGFQSTLPVWGAT